VLDITKIRILFCKIEKFTWS